MALWRRDQAGRPVWAGDDPSQRRRLPAQFTAIRFTDTLALEGLVASSARAGVPPTTPPPRPRWASSRSGPVPAASPFRDGPLRQLADVERLTTDYVHWYNHDRLHGELGHIPPEEYEQAYYAAPPDPPPGESSHRKTA